MIQLRVSRNGIRKWDKEQFTHPPISPREFLRSPAFNNEAFFESVIPDFCELNSGKYLEAVITGGIGSGKTTLALYTQKYQLYLLSALRSPQSYYGFDPASEIVIIFQSRTEKLARGVDFQRFREMISRSPYFTSLFPFDKNIKSELVFPNRIIVRSVSGDATATLGQNVICGILDEVNFMEIVSRSKRSRENAEYNQALELYNSIVKRRKSRFTRQHLSPGVLCLVSSRRYPGQFTDIKEAEAKHDPTIFVYNKRVWEVRPRDFEGEPLFSVFVGDATRKPFIVDPEHPSPDESLTRLIPSRYLTDFRRDIYNAVRDIAGESTIAVHPFITDTVAVRNAFGKCQSALSVSVTDMSDSIAVLQSQFYKPDEPRYLHLDLALTTDSAGIACGMVDRFITIHRSLTTTETLPVIRFDFTLEIKPPMGGEIDLSSIRDLIYRLSQSGLTIRWISADTYQSADTLQLLRQRGYMVGSLSVDKTPAAYSLFKTALLDGRIEAPLHEKAVQEILSLEADTMTGKIDHPPSGSKDIADAMAAVAYGISMRRDVWVRHGVPMQVATI